MLLKDEEYEKEKNEVIDWIINNDVRVETGVAILKLWIYTHKRDNLINRIKEKIDFSLVYLRFLQLFMIFLLVILGVEIYLFFIGGI